MEQQKRYGHFDDQHREYVITDPQTPWPWINYLGNEDFFSLISNTAGGYSFYKDAKFRRITRYRYNNVPMDNGGRYFYIKDGETVWNPGWKPCKTPLDFYECRHGMSYTRITGKKNGVEASVLFFVPLKKWCEVQKLTLKNESNEVKNLKMELEKRAKMSLVSLLVVTAFFIDLRSLEIKSNLSSLGNVPRISIYTSLVLNVPIIIAVFCISVCKDTIK